MAKTRSKENVPLPKRWRFTHNAYYYQVPPGLEHRWDGKKTFRLGDRLNEAYKVWADRLRLHDASKVSTIGQLLDRYALEVIPTKAAATQITNQGHVANLRAVFGDMPLLPFPPKLVYQYVDRRAVKRTDPETGRVTGGRIAAHREVELLSHAYTKAVEWGYIDRHPFKSEIRLTGGESQKTRYVEDWEVVECLILTPRRKSGSVLMIQSYLRLKLMTGMSQGDLLRLQPAVHFKDEGIQVQRHKTAESSGKTTTYHWTPELVSAIEVVLATRTSKKSDFLFCNRRGDGYMNEEVGRASGWKSMWQRFMIRVLSETKVIRPFTEHDMRAKVASDAKTLDHARALLAHADARTTNKWYRRKPEGVAPAALGKEIQQLLAQHSR